MKTRLVAPPWGAPALTEEAEEAVSLLRDNIWHDASIQFYSERASRAKAGRSTPKGMQRYLNMVMCERFSAAGWTAGDGYFIKENTWVRVTFRHQMSLGSDFFSALKVCKKEGIELAIILAANRSTLSTITPNDAAAIVSFEKLVAEFATLEGVMDIPLLIGELTPFSDVPNSIARELEKPRPRDITVTVEQLKR